MANTSRKQLKQPDQFISFWTRAGEAFSRNTRTAGLAAGAAVLVAGAAWGAAAWVENRSAGLSRDFGRIERIATAPLIAEGDAAKTQKFEDDLPHFKTEGERQDAVAKEIEAFLAAHGESKLAPEALLLKARYQLVIGKGAEAVATYGKLLGGPRLEPRMRLLAQYGLGQAHQAANDDEKALAAFSALANETATLGADTFFRDRALFARARLLDKKGDAKEAEKIFREILEKFPTSPLREKINDRLAALTPPEDK